MAEEKSDLIERPPVWPARVYRVNTGQCGSCYITICHTGSEGDPDYKLVEVFATVGGTGGCPAAFLQAVTRMVSLSLRSGVPEDRIINTLRKVRCPLPFYGNPWMGKGQTLSCVNAVARILQLEMKLGQSNKEEGSTEDDQS